MSITKVAAGPTNVSVNQNVTMTVTFDSRSIQGNIGKPVSVTYSYPGGSFTDSTNIGSSTVVLKNFVTPGMPCTVTYTIDAAGQASQSGSFRVYGPAASFSFDVKSAPLILADGTIAVMANGYSTQKFLLTVNDSGGNTINASGIRITSSVRGSLGYVLDASSRAIVTVGPSSMSSTETITASVDGVAGTKSYSLRFIDGKLDIKAYNNTDDLNEISKTEIGNIINLVVTLTDGATPLDNVPVAIKGIWPNGTVDSVNSSTYNTSAGSIAINNKFRAGLLNNNTVNVFLAQVPGLGLMDAAMVSGYSTNAAHLEVIVAPADPSADGTSYRSLKADGMHGYYVIAHVTDIYGNSVVGVPVAFNTYANIGTNGEFTDEITSIYNAETSDLGTASGATQPALNPGKIKVNVSTINGLSKAVILYFTAGPPSRINLGAYPAIIASSSVIKNTNITYQVNATQIVAYVTDDWGHPIPDQRVNLTVVPVNNVTNGTMTPATGTTDINGMFSANFNLSSTVAGDGDITVCASSGTLPNATAQIHYTENSFLNITTTVDKSRVAVNGTIGVTVNVDGVGWQVGRKPADVMLVMDRSGSMGDALGFTNYGTDAGGWFAPTVATYSGLSTGGSTNLTYTHDKKTRMIFKLTQSNPSYPAPGATYVAARSDFPATMNSGETRYVNITMRNTGGLPWMESSVVGPSAITEGVRLGGLNSNAYNTPFGMDGTSRDKITPLTVVNTGDEYTFTFAITAPVVHGNQNKQYTLQYQMVWDYTGGVSGSKTWFGDIVQKTVTVYTDNNPTPTPAPTPVPTPYATRVSDNFPTIIDSGETKTVTVTMKNTGDASFPWSMSNNQYSLGFYNPDYSKFGISSNYYVSAFATGDIHKNDQVSFTFPITGPLNVAANQSLTVYFRMYKDGTGFGDAYSRTITVYNSSIPHASAIYGDWYYVSNIWKPDNTKVTGLSNVPGWAYINPASTTANGALSGSIPTTGSTGSGLTINSAAPLGTYKIQTSRYYTSGANVPFNIYVWDDMKMGQLCDWDAVAKRSARTFIDNNITNVKDRVGLVTFSSTATTDKGLTYINQGGPNKQSVKDAINTTNSGGSTNFADGLLKARQEYEKNGSASSSKIEIFLTDGWSNVNPAQDIIEAQNTANDHITVFTIGIGDVPGQVNESYLTYLANMTGGRYFFVRDNAQLLQAYATIGRIIEENITRTSVLNVVPDMAQIGGVWYNNTTYVDGSAFVMTDNNQSSLHQVSPTITFNGSAYKLSWPIDAVRIGGSWKLNFTVRANMNGLARPVGMSSMGVFTPFDNASMVFNQNVYSDAVYIGDNGTLSSADILGVNITLPAANSNIAQPYQVIAWNVSYNSTGIYKQLIEFAPAGSSDYRPIASGFGGNQTSSFNTVWDIVKMAVGPGTYTIRITATDGMFTAAATREVTISYISGLINIGEPDTKVPY